MFHRDSFPHGVPAQSVTSSSMSHEGGIQICLHRPQSARQCIALHPTGEAIDRHFQGPAKLSRGIVVMDKYVDPSKDCTLCQLARENCSGS